MKKRMILFSVLTLMGTGAAFAWSNGSTEKMANKAFCDESCPPECCVVTAGKTAPDACCFDPGCCE